MITLERDHLTFRFPEVHEEATCSVGFQRTLRIPDDEKTYPLPPGLGDFPLRHLDDYARRLPQNWLTRGGVILPMHQAEAMWINFGGGWGADYPCAVKIATGKICAVTGAPWVDHLNRDPQDYVVLPEQPWLDGFCVGKGVIRQFVAMPLGDGYTAEEQITGAAEHGGIQIVAYPMKRERFEKLQADRVGYTDVECLLGMGLALGGRMRQEIFDDYYGLDAWDQRNSCRCFVSITNSATWTTITGERPPTEPPTAAAYTKAGLPWFEYYGGDNEAVAGAEKLAGLASVAEARAKKGVSPLCENESVDIVQTIGLRGDRSDRVREMTAR